jgi:hypothetical protein
VINVYICPTPGCPDYYGMGGMGDLSATRQGHRGANFERRSGSVHHTRADCPTCRAHGRGRVERVRVTLEVERPQPITTTDLPALSGYPE